MELTSHPLNSPSSFISPATRPIRQLSELEEMEIGESWEDGKIRKRCGVLRV